MQVSVIIVNYNVRHFLEQCLHSLKAALAGLQAEVWVVDNCSTDGSAEALRPLFPEVQWIENAQNEGFAKANNRALAVAKGEWVLFVNPDTLLPAHCLQDCLTFTATRPDAGAIGVRMVDGSGRYLPESKRGFPGLWTSWCKLSGLTALFPHSALFARYYMGHLSSDQSHQVDVLAGAFMLVRRELCITTGGFDERFFMYGEDIDLSYQISQIPITGLHNAPTWKNYYFADTTIVHFKGESTQKASPHYVKLFYKAMVQFVNKHYSTAQAQWFTFFIYLAIFFHAGLSLLSGIPYKAYLWLKRCLKPSLKANKSSREAWWVAGTAADVKEVDRLISGLSTHVSIAGVLEPEDVQNLRVLDTGDKLLPKKQAIVWCISPQLPLSTILKHSRSGSKIKWWFHYRGSQSFVSSSSSSRAGTQLSSEK